MTMNHSNIDFTTIGLINTNTACIKSIAQSNIAMSDLISSMSLKMADLIAASELNTSHIQELTLRIDQLTVTSASPMDKTTAHSLAVSESTNPAILVKRHDSTRWKLQIRDSYGLKREIRNFICANIKYDRDYEISIMDQIMESCHAIFSLGMGRVLREIMDILFDQTEYQYENYDSIKGSINDIITKYSFE
jgi:hypothetical protein